MYYKQLNGIRAFAVFGPLFVHLWPHNVPNSIYTKAVAHIGSLGVDLFFDLSGFLITGILLQLKDNISNKENSIGRGIFIFYLRRSIRIFPIYYLYLSVLYLNHYPELVNNSAWYFGYLSNFHFILTGKWGGWLTHTWSLSVEEQFYLVWPFIILLVPKKYLLSLFTLLFCLGPIYRVIMILLGYNSLVVELPPVSCMDPLVGGAILALWIRNYQSHYSYTKLKFLGIMGFISLVVHILYYVLVLKGGSLNLHSPFFRTSGTLVFMWLIGAAALEKTSYLGHVLKSRPLDYIGKISYGIYLYHLAIPWALYTFLHITMGRTVSSFFIITVLTILVSIISWHFIEHPLNKLKRLLPHN